MAQNRTRRYNNRRATEKPTILTDRLPFFVFPEWRIYVDFPWPIWAAGWISIFKAFLWLATDPVIPSPLSEYMAVKYLLTMIPFAVFGVGVWNLRKWAVWGLLILCVVDLVFYIIFPAASSYIAGNKFFLLAIVLLICTGPLGNIMILVAGPSMLKQAGKSVLFRDVLRTEAKQGRES